MQLVQLLQCITLFDRRPYERRISRLWTNFVLLLKKSVFASDRFNLKEPACQRVLRMVMLPLPFAAHDATVDLVV